MFQKLSIDLAQVKAENTLENLLNKILQVIYSLYRQKEINKELYNSIMKQVKFKRKWVLYL